MSYWKGYRDRVRRGFTWQSFVETFLLILAARVAGWWIEYMGAPRWLSSLAGYVIVFGAVILAKRWSR